jgi:hypothetical protein
MKETLNPNRSEELRARTLDNNLTWLESFGCEIERQAEIIYVQHRELLEYNAHLVLGLSKATLTHLESLLAEVKVPSPHIYVDERFGTDVLLSMLENGGFRPVLISQIKASRVALRPANAIIDMKLAQAADHAQWSALYSEGFARLGKAAEADSARWQKSFGNPRVLHWFFVYHGQQIGVCQTCIFSGVVGVYSFTLRPRYRRVTMVICAARALRTEILRRGETIIYFERVRNLAPVMPTTPSMFRSLNPIRTFVDYNRVEESSD